LQPGFSLQKSGMHFNIIQKKNQNEKN